jgi:hypothetical protein
VLRPAPLVEAFEVGVRPRPNRARAAKETFPNIPNLSHLQSRYTSLDIARAGHAALALNLYGLKAPEALFAGRRAELAQLVGERIWRLASPSAGTLTGMLWRQPIYR